MRSEALFNIAYGRAGPAPDSEDGGAPADEEDGDDMVGAPSDDEAEREQRGGVAAPFSASGGSAPQRLAREGLAGPERRAAAGARHGSRQRVMPAVRSADPGSAALTSKGVEQPLAGAAGAASAPGPLPERGAHTGEGTEPRGAALEAQGRGGGPAGRAARKGAPEKRDGHTRRRKPLSRLQRIEAEVQAKKVRRSMCLRCVQCPKSVYTKSCPVEVH